MEQADSLELAVEEFAVALHRLGQPDAGRALVQQATGEQSDAEIDARLQAAVHSLVARGLLTIDLERRESRLDTALVDATSAVVTNDFFVQCLRMGPGSREIDTFFVRSDNIVQHRNALMTTTLETIPSKAVALQRIAALYALPVAATNGTLSNATFVSAMLPASIVQRFGNDDPGAIIDDIYASPSVPQVPEAIATAIAEDVSGVQSLGTVMRVEEENGAAVSPYSILVVSGTERIWLFEIESASPEMIQVYPADRNRFLQLLPKTMS